MYQNGLIYPVLTLVAWSLFVWLWMILGRVSVMRRERIHPQKAVRTREFSTSGREQWVADNYNHLMEQPTIFYAAALAAHAAGIVDGLNIGFAWAYVLTRMAHTLIQTGTNVVMTRFYAFIGSTVALAIMVLYTLLRMLAGG